MQRLLYMTSITALIISINSGLLGGLYYQNSFLRGAANLLVLILSYRFIRIESISIDQKAKKGIV